MSENEYMLKTVNFIKNLDVFEGVQFKQRDIVNMAAVATLWEACENLLYKKPKTDERTFLAIPEISGGPYFEPCTANMGHLLMMSFEKFECQGPIRLMEGVVLPKDATNLDALFANLRAYGEQETTNLLVLDDDTISEVLETYRRFKHFVLTPELRNLIMTFALIKVNDYEDLYRKYKADEVDWESLHLTNLSID